ncbi:Mss4p nuclear export [Exophiala xenobiotica]|nr:Mss4p nuclear export [Exophiala xenobiotica]KAK5233511.1 Mss4p nuclear export [Exophiala xenobiotica]KAK5245193.1 Mss4p nuclear export [Exophiala xenobiotica]KAK5349189.1 Mss4p nuclear export [Exophiala xenobiotica]KAK5365678.1 Mss4p nuclear export [Exophiala xenobiotica]
MSKRKEIGDNVVDKDAMVDDDSGDDEDFDVLNVDFEWFDPQPEVDFHGIKTLLQQLFDVDAQLFELSGLTDLILSQPTLGSTVKVDGNETDAYAFLSVLNLQQHKDQLFMGKLIQYLQSKSKSKPELAPIADLLSQPTIPSIGLVLTDRLINVPSEVVPPMYSMLLEEIQWAIDDKEPYNFSHYLILSKTYTEVASKLDAEENRPKKKNKAAGTSFETMYFHPEDEVLHRHAICHGGYDYSTKQDEGHSDSKRAFQELGIKPQGHAILISADKFKVAVQDVAEYLKPQA